MTTLLDPGAREFYCHTLRIFRDAHLPVLIGGACAFARYTGIERHTKDLDVFVREEHFQPTLDGLARAGYVTDAPFPHWLGKAHHGEFFVDVIFGSGNGIARVDDDWFTHAVSDHVFDEQVLLCPAEEMIWSKGFIQERERFDGADIAHLLKARADDLDWQRLLRRFGAHWRVLLAHLVLFGYIYPSEHDRIPGWVMQDLLRHLDDAMSAAPTSDRACFGTVLSRQQYLVDVEHWGYRDVRTGVENPMTDADIAAWTAGIADDGSN